MKNDCSMISDELKSFIRSIPKAELHVHYDSVYPETLLQLAERNKVRLPYSDVDSAIQLFTRIRTLQDFLKLWKASVSVIKTEEDYADIALAMGADMKRQNILRREAMFTYAAAHESRGVPLETVMAGLAEGRRAVKQAYGVDLHFIADIDRTIAPERSLKFINDIEKYRDEAGIVAIGLDCAELGYPAAVHTEAFRRAGELGFKRCAHSGEEDGAHSVWSAINDLQVDRVDHGVRAIEDDDLVDYLATHNIPLTVCPKANTPWIYETVADGPLKKFMDKGVPVTVNSDDPPFLITNKKPTDLNDNYEMVAEAFHLSVNEIADLARNSFFYSFAGEDDKNNYLQQLDNWLGERLQC